MYELRVNPDNSYTLIWGETIAIIPYFPPINRNELKLLISYTENRLSYQVVVGAVIITTNDGVLVISCGVSYIVIERDHAIGVLGVLPWVPHKPVQSMKIQMTIDHELVLVSSLDTDMVHGIITKSELFAIMNYIHKGVLDESTGFIQLDANGNITVRDLLIPRDLQKEFRKRGYAVFQNLIYGKGKKKSSIPPPPITVDAVNDSFDKIQKKLSKKASKEATWSTKNKQKSPQKSPPKPPSKTPSC